MNSRESILQGDDPHAVTDLEMPEAWEAGYLFDPNLENIPTGHPSEDVLAWIITENSALLMALDGISQGTSGTTANFNSRACTVRFAEEALAFARPFLESRRLFDLWKMHHHAASQVQSSYLGGDESLPPGGLVGSSTLFLPNGVTQTHRFGDIQELMSTDPTDPTTLAVPRALWPESTARGVYLQQESEVAAGRARWTPQESEEKWRRLMLTPPPALRNVTRYAGTHNGLRINQEEADHHQVIPEGGFAIKATDGLGIYTHFDGIRTRGAAGDLLKQFYIYGQPESMDNIAGFAVRRKP